MHITLEAKNQWLMEELPPHWRGRRRQREVFHATEKVPINFFLPAWLGEEDSKEEKAIKKKRGNWRGRRRRQREVFHASEKSSHKFFSSYLTWGRRRQIRKGNKKKRGNWRLRLDHISQGDVHYIIRSAHTKHQHSCPPRPSYSERKRWTRTKTRKI